ncbi:hypothetical protein LPA04_26460 [Lacticaseibacillus paracasei subsp. paracasei]|nr:hypothetical protein LPA04_26460 [Lacticaseibacillus paracasei subsp. paracasei]
MALLYKKYADIRKRHKSGLFPPVSSAIVPWKPTWQRAFWFEYADERISQN